MLGFGGAASAAAGFDMYDVDANGVVDASGLDTNLDGWPDQNVVWVAAADGQPSLMWLLDKNQDRVLDEIAGDSNRDGYADTWIIDNDQNGYFEQGAVDSNGDGLPDGVTSMPPPSGGLGIVIYPEPLGTIEDQAANLQFSHQSPCYGSIWTLPDEATCSIR
jgi:hypothetical protein